MSVRQTIIDNAAGRFMQVLVANGYETDIGQRVYHWKETGFNEKNCPCISFFDEKSEVEDSDNVYQYKKLRMDIGLVDVSSTDAVMRSYIRDILTMIGQDESWGGNAYETTLEGDETEKMQLDKAFWISQVTIFIHYKTERWED